MAKVEMTGFEYMNIMDKQKELEELKRGMVDAFKLRFEDEDSIPYASYMWSIPEEVAQEILKRTAAELVNHPKAIKTLYEENTPCLVVTTGYFSRDWGGAKDPNTVDLRDVPEFKKIWDDFDETKDQEEE